MIIIIVLSIYQQINKSKNITKNFIGNFAVLLLEPRLFDNLNRANIWLE